MLLILNKTGYSLRRIMLDRKPWGQRRLANTVIPHGVCALAWASGPVISATNADQGAVFAVHPLDQLTGGSIDRITLDGVDSTEPRRRHLILGSKYLKCGQVLSSIRLPPRNALALTGRNTADM